jgi:stalled ribosome rescue protein Dom34
MKSAILFVDSDHAKIFNLVPGKMETVELKKHEIKHHLTADKNNEEHEKHFFHEVATALKGVTELLVVGPGFAKNRFQSHLETHHHGDLAKSIVGLDTIDHPTDPQIMAVGRKFFKAYDLFH